ncbi:MAG: hypothetical protein P4L84_19605 [Isosphaeraceae bacterium]|nr:hypothetical protein [Isosphaeraceae bacterium]
MPAQVSRASAVVVQRVPAAAVDWFLEWQEGVTNAAEGFPGYSGTNIFPPTDGQREEWVVIVNFEDDASLNAWLESPVRGEWLKELWEKVGEFDLQRLSGGFGPWFAGASGSRGEGPSAWKMALTVLLALFPTVMLLTIFVAPYTAPLGLALSMLIGNALSVSILQWGVMPVLTRLLGPWLSATYARQKAVTLAGSFAIFLALGVLVVIFRQVTG